MLLDLFSLRKLSDEKDFFVCISILFSALYTHRGPIPIWKLEMAIIAASLLMWMIVCKLRQRRICKSAARMQIKAKTDGARKLYFVPFFRQADDWKIEAIRCGDGSAQCQHTKSIIQHLQLPLTSQPPLAVVFI